MLYLLFVCISTNVYNYQLQTEIAFKFC